MKIGILTLPPHTSYGGILQAYALQKVIERIGHTVSVLDNSFYPVPLPLHLHIYYFARTIASKILGRYKGPLSTKKRIKYIDKEQQFTQRFIQQYLNRVVLRSLSDTRDLALDGIVVGSDQIWRPKYFQSAWKERIESAFLNFTDKKDILKLAYSVSFGTDKWEFNRNETKNCKRLIKTFTAVSMREASGVKLCREHLGYSSAIQTLDPTMLLTREEYIQLFEVAGTQKSQGTLFYYFLDSNADKMALVNRIAAKKNLIPFRTELGYANPKKSRKDNIIPPVENWLRSFYDAKMVITDSFHGSVFSIIFNKPFLVVGNRKRGLSRFESLLALFGLEQCLLSSPNDCFFEEITFDWPRINTVWESRKKDCIDFLIENCTPKTK